MQTYSHKKLILSKILSVLTCIACLYCIVAIIDYSPSDPSLLHASSNSAENITGLYGAYIADLLVQSLGYVSLVPIFFVAVIAGNILAEQRNKFLMLRITLLWFSLPIMALACAKFDMEDGINDLVYEIKRCGGFIGYYLYSELMLKVKHKYIDYFSIIYSIIAFFVIIWVPLAVYKKTWKFLSKLARYLGIKLANLIVHGYVIIMEISAIIWLHFKQKIANKKNSQALPISPQALMHAQPNVIRNISVRGDARSDKYGDKFEPKPLGLWGKILQKIRLIGNIAEIDNAQHNLMYNNSGNLAANHSGNYIKENGNFTHINKEFADKHGAQGENDFNTLKNINNGPNLAYIGPLSSLLNGGQSPEAVNKFSENVQSASWPNAQMRAANFEAAGKVSGNVSSANSGSKQFPRAFQGADISGVGYANSKAVSSPNSPNFFLPSLNLLQPHKGSKIVQSKEELEKNAQILTQVLQEFGVNGEITKISPGPVVTLYELVPAAGTKSSRVINLADDIARSMSALSVRIAVLPGKNAIGIELPNRTREMVALRDLIDSPIYLNEEIKLPLALGKNISGEPVVAELAKMPHLLVAGTTGSGKSVAINTMILSLIYKNTPEQCKFIMIDPKMLELSMYEGIPHLLAPVVTDPKKAVITLRWVVKEMESRYRAMSVMGVRNIQGYNRVIQEAIQRGEEAIEKQVQVGFDAQDKGQPLFESVRIAREVLPYIVVIVDEMADLMLVAGKDIEGYIQRIAQMARAAGIHLIMATQRPSVDVITGVIKANFPTRISFQVTSKIDSRTILGEIGAEQLLGMGDMLFMMPGGKIERVHGPFVSDSEVEKVVQNLKAQGAPQYVQELINIKSEASSGDDSGEEGDGLVQDSDDATYRQAVEIVLREGKATVSYVQRCMRIGYNRAANLIERMEREGIITAPNSAGKREILARDLNRWVN